jgi:hypothetical protein
VALIAIVCPTYGHRSAVTANSLPRTLQCITCGHAHAFERVTAIETQQLAEKNRSSGQRLAALREAFRALPLK